MLRMILKCGSCGSDNLPQAKYCSGCGEAVAILMPLPVAPEPIKIVDRSASLMPWVMLVLILSCSLVLLIRYDKKGKFVQRNASITPESVQTDHQKLMESAGAMPEIDPIDKSVYCVRYHMMQASIDARYLELSDWATPSLINKNGAGYWSVNVTVRTQTQDGVTATIKTFLIQKNKVVEVSG